MLHGDLKLGDWLFAGSVFVPYGCMVTDHKDHGFLRPMIPVRQSTIHFPLRRLLCRPLNLLLPLLLLRLVPACRAQQQTATDYVYGLCGTEVYESNSVFASNLNTVLSNLKHQASEVREKFYMSNSTTSSDNSSWAFGMYECRGDLSGVECSRCALTILETSLCGANVMAISIQFVGCYLRYDHSDFTALNDYRQDARSNCSSQENANSQYQADLDNAISEVANAAADAANYTGYATTTVGSAHALAQCLFYLSSSQCAACLNQSSNRSTFCANSASGYFYYVGCYYLFSDTDLTISSSSPSSSSPPALPPHPSSTFQSPAAMIGQPAKSASTKLSAAAIAGISVAGSAAAATAVYVLCVLKKRRGSRAIALGVRSASNFPSKFSVKELRLATERFHPRNRLGQGGFGVVYKGTLRNGMEVAIKVISLGEKSGGKTADFMNEAKLITTVKHRNLIRLLGCATDSSRCYLVHEYLPNRSLDLHLFATDSSSSDDARPLDWKTRFNIITGIARALCYLHEESHVRIVHRDIKASNILLDGNLEPKIADFGLARLFPTDASHLTTALAGTFGYVAPEYAVRGQLSEKVDVYRFGVLALEIVSGRRVVESNVADSEHAHTHILEWAWAVYERNQLLETVDRRILTGTVEEGEVTRAVMAALLCTQTKPQARPTMSQICKFLYTNFSPSAAAAVVDLPSRPANVGFDSMAGGSEFAASQYVQGWDVGPITELRAR